MKNRLNIFMAIASLALAALACQAVTGSPSAPEAPTESVIENTIVPADTDVPLPTETEEPAPSSDVLYEDDFSAG